MNAQGAGACLDKGQRPLWQQERREALFGIYAGLQSTYLLKDNCRGNLTFMKFHLGIR